jgi:hypothetical protein
MALGYIQKRSVVFGVLTVVLVAGAQVTSARENINRQEGSVEAQKSLIRQMEAAVAE